jgi:predicted phage terminase large subunit-like protein
MAVTALITKVRSLQRLRAQLTAEREKPRKAIEARVPLVQFVHKLSPELAPPTWLGPFAELLEKAVAAEGAAGGVRAVVAAPPQHGKTELILRAFIWWAIRCPGKRHAYITYNEDRAEEVSRDFIRVAELAGLKPTGTLSGLRLKGGTKIRFTSVKGSITGFPVDGVCVIDDPIKGHLEAQSATIRKRCRDFFQAEAFTRRHKGTSYIVMATRWHPEDLSGWLIGKGWQYVNLKAIAEGPVDDNGIVESDPLHRHPGESLWPERKPPEFFVEERKDPHWWAAMYQGEPRPRGAGVFSAEPRFYSELPKAGYRGAYGIDLAYTAKTVADWSICVELWRVETKDPKRPLFYVVDVIRKQVEAPQFASLLRAKRNERPWKMRWYRSGTEKGSADFIRNAGVQINALTARGDKFVRSIPVAAAWNEGRVLLPDPEKIPAPWLSPFMKSVQDFTGVGEEQDDDADAFAAGHDELTQGATSGKMAGASGSDRE